MAGGSGRRAARRPGGAGRPADRRVRPSARAPRPGRREVTRLRQFVLVVVGEPTEEQVELLLSGSDDACIETDPPSGEAWITFDREAPSLVDAIVTGVRDLRCAGLEPSWVRADDDVVSLGVIAQRISRSETVVRGWAEGDTGPGGFPAPVAAHPRRPCYSWQEVVPWLRVHCG